MSATYEEIVRLVHLLPESELDEVREHLEAMLQYDVEDEQLSDEAQEAVNRARSGLGKIYRHRDVLQMMESREKDAR